MGRIWIYLGLFIYFITVFIDRFLYKITDMIYIVLVVIGLICLGIGYLINKKNDE
ncbi:hypothetical protein NMU03_07700 [Allocoprobacillus halotolerans]|uniref:Uncharacterized protein n=1 Tax=Allocoprobacillus halotolerans TaxID=2944914 RepID=A0ABY5I6D8_9FIRM|nr:hypothetical protein [Allocoprobacillus halotolerans]UTY40640.1 hypothetical protein NMU03_07700 [Allocoprobacillus halotolerans]